MGNLMNEKRIQQNMGIAYAIFIISALLIWYGISVYWYLNLKYSIYMIVGMQLLLGLIMIVYTMISFYATKKIANWILTLDIVTKADAEEINVSIEEAPKKESRLSKIKAKAKSVKDVATFSKKVDSGGTPPEPEPLPTEVPTSIPIPEEKKEVVPT
jgi:diacylglycerol kinase